MTLLVLVAELILLIFYITYKKGLRLLAVHYDNTWNSNISTMNIRNLLKSLNIDLYTHVINNKEADDILSHFSLQVYLKLKHQLI